MRGSNGREDLFTTERIVENAASRRGFLKVSAGSAVAALAGCLSSAEDGDTLGYAYVANAASGTVSVIDRREPSVTETIEIGDRTSHGIGAGPDGEYLYASDYKGGNVHVVSTDDFEIDETVDVGLNVHGIDVSPDGRHLYVSGDNYDGAAAGSDDHDHDHGDQTGSQNDQTDDSGEVVVIDTEEYETVGTVETQGSGHVTFGPEDRAYVTMYHLSDEHRSVNEFGVVDRNEPEMVETFSISDSVVNAMAISTDGDVVYAGSRMGNSVTVIDTESGEELDRIRTGTATHELTVSPDGEYLWTANRGSDDVRVIEIDSGEIVETIDAGNNHISVSPDGSEVYVTSVTSDEVIIVDRESYEITSRINVGEQPHELVFADGG
ncbi:beta-propeller fold lactonase family protein [Natronolimnohabitans sp. A-GB9]|uniref:beta-propeller fold lactonase family protein n=1 Tax=Natronolimnohabitans sp. A-GB9 TaxID=3069757 RepID=UPI0027B6E55E|nr:beta-propeller fold lactonase family protein [Natronolimnohabitans sp. A-GB9]MDQ2051703.1 beta-propeller fold lactonase family protein [Natronolimnohabitans sp. A-GB9]